MNKAEVIKWRDTLKAGKNYPLKIIFDNNYHVDESLPLNYVKWDDTNGIVYCFRLSNFGDSNIPSNNAQIIDVFSAPYEIIWVLEMPRFKLDEIDTLFGSMESNGITFGGNFKERIKYGLSEAIHPNRWRMEHSDINAMTGAKVLDESNEYYQGRFHENFKETREHALLNKHIAEKNNVEP